MIYNVLLVSGVQQSDSVIHVHIFILFYILFSHRLSQNTEQSSLCYAVGPCWLSTLPNIYSGMCVCVHPRLLIYPSLPHFPFGNHKFVFNICKSISVLQISSFVSFLFLKFRFHIWVISFDICLSLSDLFAQYDDLQVHPYWCKWHYFILFYG